VGWVTTGLVLAVLAFLWWRRREGLTATEAYCRLRERLARSGVEVPDSMPPLEVQRAVSERFPGSAMAAHRLLRLYLEESYGERALTTGQLHLLRGSLQQVERVLRKAS
jgi:hypothetical protein